MTDELIRRWSPYLRYDSSESYFADSCATLVENAGTGPGARGNVLKRGDGRTVLAAVRPAGGQRRLTLDLLRARRYGGAGGPTVRRTDFLDATAAERHHVADARALHADPRYGDRVYGRLVEDGGRRWLQYWLFYYFNSWSFLGAGVHEGDWELLQLRLDPRDKPDAATFAQHGRAFSYPWAGVERAAGPEGDVPVVYVARDSHASYRRPGFNLPALDYADGRGPMVRPEVELVGERIPEWVAWPGRWGASDSSPRGPAFQRPWSDPAEFYEDGRRAVGLAARRRALAPPPLPPAPCIRATRVDDRAVVEYRFPAERPAGAPAPARLVVSVDAPDEPMPAFTERVDLDGDEGTLVHPALLGAERYVVRAFAEVDGHLAGPAVLAEVGRPPPGAFVCLPGEPAPADSEPGVQPVADAEAVPGEIDGRRIDALPDPVDFRDLEFQPTLVEVPAARPLEAHLRRGIEVRDQGEDGACTGFALAAVVDILLDQRDRTRRSSPRPTPVSARMLYAMARRNDEWAGEDYAGSSARGAMKGWHKRGVCARVLWDDHETGTGLRPDRVTDGRDRPLGAYYRVNKRDLVAMHSAIAEVGALFATASVHAGWSEVDPASGRIPFEGGDMLGGHAFAIVGYERTGFWIQNSWGPGWGLGGHALLTYDDWLENATDAWVARLGAPVTVGPTAATGGQRLLAGGSDLYEAEELRPHVVLAGNDGRPEARGTYGNSETDLRRLVGRSVPEAIAQRGWRTRRVLVYAHGGLVSEDAALRWLGRQRGRFLDAEVYPLLVAWRTDVASTLGNILGDLGRSRRAGDIFDRPKDYLRDRLDDLLEPLARRLGVRTIWNEIKENALRASEAGRGAPADPAGAGRIVGEELARLAREDEGLEIHLAAHSAGAILLAPLAQLLATRGRIRGGPLAGSAGLGVGVASCTLLAPACTVDLFRRTYLPTIDADGLGRFSVFALTDRRECDDTTGPAYHKSVLYLVSNALEAWLRIPKTREGVPILGMQRFAEREPALSDGRGELVLSPNGLTAAGGRGAAATTHVGFDDDRVTLDSLVARIRTAPGP